VKTLLRLYPRAWRERYGDEMLALLEAQPASLLDRLDLIGGAIDAHLHPQVRGAENPDKESSVSTRVLALVAAIGGLAWMAGFAIWLTSPLDPEGGHEAAPAVLVIAVSIALMGIGIGELGTRIGSAGSRLVGHLIAGASIVGAVGMPLPVVFNVTDQAWAVMVYPLFFFPVLAVLAVVRGQRNGIFPAWLTLAVMFGAGSAWVGFGGTTPESAKFVGLLFGAAFVLLGLQSLVAPRRATEPAAA
jgi:hypothetical protein